jgi:hypothetical protein
MDKEKIRERFCFYRQRIAELEKELDFAYYHNEQSRSRADRRLQAYERELAERERQAEAERWYHEEELRKATRDLERAHNYGDDCAVSRALERIKRIT